MLDLGCILLWITAEVAAGPGWSGMFLPSASLDQLQTCCSQMGGPLVFPDTPSVDRCHDLILVSIAKN